MPKKSVSSSLFGSVGSGVPDEPALDPDLEAVLTLLRTAPRHRYFLAQKVTGVEGVIKQLRALGHNIKSSTFGSGKYSHYDWVYCLSEGGRLCGVEGPAGADPA